MGSPEKPNFLYIGPDKAGSSWLHEVLITHAEVFMPQAKDLYYFDRYYDRGDAWYLSQFDDADAQHRVVGEVCQDYLFHAEAPRRIRRTLAGDVRFMVTLRDPADRAYSSYLYMLKQGERPGSFVQALQTRPELLEHGRYATHLERFMDEFGQQSVHVAVFDDLVADPQRFIDDVLSFLRIAPMSLAPELLAARLPAGRARSVVVARLARRAADVVRERDGANLIGRVKRSPAVQRLLYRPLRQEQRTMTADERAAVQDALAAEVQQLDHLFGLGLAQRWGWASAHVSPPAVAAVTGLS